MPDLVFADGPGLASAICEHWQPDPEADPMPQLARVLATAAAASGASLIGVSVAFGGERPHALFVALDGEAVTAQRADLTEDGPPRLSSWREVAPPQLPLRMIRPILTGNARLPRPAGPTLTNILGIIAGAAPATDTRADPIEVDP